MEKNEKKPRGDNLNKQKVVLLCVMALVLLFFLIYEFYYDGRDNNKTQHYSQGDQDVFIKKFFDQVRPKTKTFVEFGFNANSYSTGSGANSEILYKQGWTGLLLDGSNYNDVINLKKEWICSNNIVKLFDKYNVNQMVDYVSIDIDTNDFYIFESLLNSKYQPQLFSVEFNSHVPLFSTLGVKDNCSRGFECRIYSGSYSAFVKLASIFGYYPVHVTKGLDLFLTKKEILQKYTWDRVKIEDIENIGHVPCGRHWEKEIIDLNDYVDKKYNLIQKVKRTILI